jgi:hypothetical protein
MSALSEWAYLQNDADAKTDVIGANIARANASFD